MTDNDKGMFGQEIFALLMTKGQPTDPVIIEGYWRVLRELPADDFRGVIEAALRDPGDGFKLNPGKLLAMAPGTTTHLQAWAEIRAEIRAGRGDDDARVSQRHHVAVRIMGGWHGLGQSDSTALDKRVFDFREAWESAGHKVAHHERQHPPTDARQITGTVAPTARPRAPSDRLLWQFPNGVDATIEEFRAKYHTRFDQWATDNRAYELAKSEWDATHPPQPPSGQIYRRGMTHGKDRQWFGEVTKKFIARWPSSVSPEERAERAWARLGHVSRGELLAAYATWDNVERDGAPSCNDILDRIDGGHDVAGRNAQLKSNASEAQT